MATNLSRVLATDQPRPQKSARLPGVKTNDSDAPLVANNGALGWLYASPNADDNSRLGRSNLQLTVGNNTTPPAGITDVNGNAGTGGGSGLNKTEFYKGLTTALEKINSWSKTGTDPTAKTPTGGGGGTGTGGGGHGGGSGSGSGDSEGGMDSSIKDTSGKVTGGGDADALPPFELGTIDRDPTYQQLYAGLDELRGVYDQTMQLYTPKTEEQIRAQAENEYGSYYDQLRLAARQSGESQDLALAQQREGLQASYDKSREASLKQYAQGYSQADREMLRRGMQRSSYAGQTLANIGTQAAEAQQALWDEQVAAETRIDQQRTQLAQQLAQQIAQYDAGQAKDILARIQNLQDQEYDRSVAAGQARANMATQLYSFLYQMGRDDITDQEWLLQYLLGGRQQQASEWQWNKQFAETVREFNIEQANKNGDSSSHSSGGGGSSGGGSTRTETPAATTPKTTTDKNTTPKAGNNNGITDLTASFLGINPSGSAAGGGTGGAPATTPATTPAASTGANATLNALRARVQQNSLRR